MKNKILLIMLFVLSASVVMAQNDTTHKMSDTQKAQAAKADVYIINSKKKIKDSFTLTFKDTTTATKKSKKKSCLKRNKKSS
jgi:hypothetical protein